MQGPTKRLRAPVTIPVPPPEHTRHEYDTKKT